MKSTLKATILTKRKIEYLFDHILDGFKSSHQGAQYIRKDGIINEQEYQEILEKNSERLIQRIHEFKIAHKLLSITFVFMFTWMQVSGEDLDMRRSSRTRTTSRTQRSGRRKNEL